MDGGESQNKEIYTRNCSRRQIFKMDSRIRSLNIETPLLVLGRVDLNSGML